MRPPARDQFAGDQPCLYRLAQTYAIGEQQPRPRQFQCAHQRNELIRLDPNPARFRHQHVGRPEHLLEQAGLMVQPPRQPASRHIRPRSERSHFDRFGRMQDVPLQATQIAIRAAQAKQRLRTQRARPPAHPRPARAR